MSGWIAVEHKKKRKPKPKLNSKPNPNPRNSVPLKLEPEELDQLDFLSLVVYDVLYHTDAPIPASYLVKKINHRVLIIAKNISQNYKLPSSSSKVGVSEQVEMMLFSKPELLEKVSTFNSLIKRDLGSTLYEGPCSDIIERENTKKPTLWSWPRITIK